MVKSSDKVCNISKLLKGIKTDIKNKSTIITGISLDSRFLKKK